MKVVRFCGGHGMRMQHNGPGLPKPMTTVGPRPLLWHVMKYYAHFGHHDFVLCLGHGARHIKNFFLRYDETGSNDFTLSNGHVELHSSDTHDWRITFVHTGLNSPIGERLRRVRRHVVGEDMFLANYADVLTDMPLNDMIDLFKASDAIGAVLAVPPQDAFQTIDITSGGDVTGIRPLQELPLWENGGYFAFRPEIFDHLPPDGDLVADACAPLARSGRLLAHQYSGFWHPVDTVKELAALEDRYRAGDTPWTVWEVGS